MKFKVKVHSCSSRLMTVITTLRRLGQEDCHEFKASLIYRENSRLFGNCRIKDAISENKYKKGQNPNKLAKTNDQKILIIKTNRYMKGIWT